MCLCFYFDILSLWSVLHQGVIWRVCSIVCYLHLLDLCLAHLQKMFLLFLSSSQNCSRGFLSRDMGWIVISPYFSNVLPQQLFCFIIPPSWRVNFLNSFNTYIAIMLCKISQCPVQPSQFLQVSGRPYVLEAVLSSGDSKKLQSSSYQTLYHPVGLS